MARAFKRIPFLNELEDINLSERLYNHVDKLSEINDYQYEFVLDKNEDVAKVIREIIEDKIDFWYTDFITRFGSIYWCGCLTAEPWCDLDRDEESILNSLLNSHTAIVIENNQILMRFVMNEESDLHEFLVKNRDGYSGNISYSIDGMRRIVVKTLFGLIENKDGVLERLGHWEDSVYEEDWEHEEEYDEQ